MPANPFAPNSQAGKVAVVTGASSGIGRATVQQLTATGWNVYALARRAERLAILEAETGAHPVTCDVTDEAAVRAAAKNILAETGGRVNALVNIAGGAIGLDRVADGSPEDYLAMYRVTCSVSSILCGPSFRHYVPAVKEASLTSPQPQQKVATKEGRGTMPPNSVRAV